MAVSDELMNEFEKEFEEYKSSTAENSESNEDSDTSSPEVEEESEEAAATEESETEANDLDDNKGTDEIEEDQNPEEKETSEDQDSKPKEPEKKKQYSRGSQRANKRLAKENEALKKRLEALEKQYVNTLPEESQKKYQEDLTKREMETKQREIQTYKAKESFFNQLQQLDDESKALIESAPGNLLIEKPSTTYAIQTAPNGAQVLAKLLKDPAKMQMFDQLGDQASLEFLNAIAMEQEHAPVVPEVKKPEVKKPVKATPKPAPKATGQGTAITNNPMKMSDDDFHNYITNRY